MVLVGVRKASANWIRIPRSMGGIRVNPCQFLVPSGHWRLALWSRWGGDAIRRRAPLSRKSQFSESCQCSVTGGELQFYSIRKSVRMAIGEAQNLLRRQWAVAEHNDKSCLFVF